MSNIEGMRTIKKPRKNAEDFLGKCQAYIWRRYRESRFQQVYFMAWADDVW